MSFTKDHRSDNIAKWSLYNYTSTHLDPEFGVAAMMPNASHGFGFHYNKTIEVKPSMAGNVRSQVSNMEKKQLHKQPGNDIYDLKLKTKP